MNHYGTSNGERVSKSVIDARIKKAKRNILDIQFEEYGHNFCVDCLRSGGVILDCSHDVSVDECQKSGNSELAWSILNIKVRCRECHIKHDNEKK